MKPGDYVKYTGQPATASPPLQVRTIRRYMDETPRVILVFHTLGKGTRWVLPPDIEPWYPSELHRAVAEALDDS